MACALYELADNVLRSRVSNPRGDNSNGPEDPAAASTDQPPDNTPFDGKIHFYSPPDATSGATFAEDSDAGIPDEFTGNTAPNTNSESSGSAASPSSGTSFPDAVSAAVVTENPAAEIHKESADDTAPLDQHLASTKESSLSGTTTSFRSSAENVFDTISATATVSTPAETSNDLPEETEASVDVVAVESESTSATSHSAAGDSPDRGPPLPSWSIETMSDAQVLLALRV